MDRMKAARIGWQQALKAVTLGVAFAQLIMVFFMWQPKDPGASFFWFTDFRYQLNIFLGIVWLYFFGFIFGRLAGIEILIQKKRAEVCGIRSAMLTLLCATMLSALTGFLQEGVAQLGTPDDPFNVYFFKPVFWILSYGIIPVTLIGWWFGRKLASFSGKVTDHAA
jgi:hypothetical protein